MYSQLTFKTSNRSFQATKWRGKDYNIYKDSSSSLLKQVSLLSSMNSFLTRQPKHQANLSSDLQWEVNNDQLHSEVLNLTSQIISKLDPFSSGRSLLSAPA